MEQSPGASKAGQVSQLVQACEPGLGDLSKLTALAYFLEVKLMFVGAMNFGHVQLLKFVVLKFFWLCSNPNFGRLDLVM